MKTFLFVLLATFAVSTPSAVAGKYKRCDKQEKKCKKNPLRKMSGDCKKARKRCEKEMAKKENRREEAANAPLPVAAIPGDMFVNSAFETLGGAGGAPSHWKVVGSQGSWQVHGGRVNAHTGANAVQLKSGSGSITQTVPLTGEGNSKGFYKLRYWVRGVGLGAKTKLSVQSESMARGSTTTERIGDHRSLPGDWKLFEKTIAIKGDEFATSVRFSWYVDRADVGKGSIWIDDVSLVKE